MTPIPYDVAGKAILYGEDCNQISEGGAVSRWVAARVRRWLEFWRQEIGRPGFYPFDCQGASPQLHDWLLRRLG